MVLTADSTCVTLIGFFVEWTNVKKENHVQNSSKYLDLERNKSESRKFLYTNNAVIVSDERDTLIAIVQSN